MRIVQPMRPRLFNQLCAIARRECAADVAEDVVQEALLAAVRAGRFDLADPANAAWVRGVVRNRARMARRSHSRRQQRETSWQRHGGEPVANDQGAGDVIDALPQALRIIATLALTGHNRREIAYLLGLSDVALRQRIVALKRRLKASDIAMPDEFTGLNLDLAYGRIRDALLPQLLRQGGVFASHDPDGHLFVVRHSRNG
jgi:DNA-directed RNA polymerase specialized sigma24 family protein